MHLFDEELAAPEVRAALETCVVFRGLDRDALDALESFSFIERVSAGSALYVQGAPGETIFVLMEGSLKLTRSIPGIRDHVVRLARPGAVLAESVLFFDESYPATAIALQDSRMLAVSTRHFVSRLQRDPHLAWNVMERLGKRIEELQSQADLLATHSAEQKVAAYLIARYRELEETDGAIALACRQSELASLLALAPETLCRVIAGFKRRGWIRSENGRIVIIDAEALAGAAPG